jgi:hypothetical protein
VWLVVLALVCHYAYSVMDSSVIDGKIHELNVKLDTLRLRGMKLAVLKGDTDVFKSYTTDAPVKCTLPSGTVVEIKETYEVLLVGVKQQKDNLEHLVLEIGGNIHNGNVEKAINNYVDEKAKVVENEISSIVENAKEEARSEYEKEIVDLKAQISELKELITTSKESA